MSGIRAVCRPATSAGFALAGIPTVEAAVVRDAPPIIAALAERHDLGVLLVEQELLDAFSEGERRELLRRPAPVIVPFPGPSWEERVSPAEEYVLELLRRAIGYRVRLR